MDLRQLRYFVTVAEFGSFSAAARHLGVAQPALSRHVKALERRLNVSLLTRTVRGAEMTAPGEKLFHFAQGLLRQIETLPEVVDEQQGVVSGRVVVGLPTSVSAVLASPLLRAARARFPQIRIHLIDLASGFLDEWMDNGRVDICVLYDAARSAKLNLDHILVEDLCLIGPAGAFPPGCEEIAFQRLGDFPLALPSAPHSLRRLTERLALAHSVRLDVVLEVDSLAVTKTFVQEGQGFIISTEGAVHAEIAAGTLGAVRIVEPTISRSVSLATSAVRGTPRACDEIRRLTLQVAQELIRSGVWKAGPRNAKADDAAHQRAASSAPARSGSRLR